MNSRKTLSAIHIGLALALPLGALLIFGFSRHDFFAFGDWRDEAASWIYWLMAMPIFAVYGGIALLRFFPTTWRGQLWAVVFPLISFTANIFLFGEAQNILEHTMLQAAIFYIAVYTVLVAGLIPLAVMTATIDLKNATRGKIIKDVLLRMFVFLLITAPIIYTQYYSWKIAESIIAEGTTISAGIFWLEVLAVGIVYLRQFWQLLREGKL